MRYIILLGLWAGSLVLSAQTADEQLLDQSIQRHADACIAAADQIWDWAELGYKELKSSALLQQQLRDAGFTVQAGIADIPTAFVASYGSGQPIIAILAEFDALPGVSQAAVPYKQEREGHPNGHACGHHLFGAGSSLAAIAVRDWLSHHPPGSGTIRLYGTPAEEGGAGKVYLVRAGVFEEVDAVLHWHPSDHNQASARSSLANKSAKFRFYGEAAHASAAPERGRSALDGVEAMNYMTQMMREHMPQSARMHYVITRGGEAPNVVPAFAEVFYYVRHPEMAQVRSLFERVVKAAEGAAHGTGTRMDYEVIHGVYNVLPNEALSRVMHEQLTRVGGVHYTPEEAEFAQAMQTSYTTDKPLRSTQDIAAFELVETGSGGSTDVGDVSWAVPTAGMGAATWVPGTSAHSWQAVAAGGTSIGHKGMVVAARTLARTAAALYQRPEVIRAAQQELQRRRGADFTYEALLGDREVPLDYRD